MRQHKLKKIAVAAALALSGAAVVPGAQAAGLGQLTVLSSLGQPLRAEIDLTSVSRSEASTLAAKMAGPDAYRQAGVEMSPAMLGVRVAVNRRANGNYYLSLSSSTPINDPFVDALIEVNWASGRLVREYTFLLDPVDIKPVAPPVAAATPPRPAAAPAQVVTPPAAATQPPAETPQPAAQPTPAAVPDAVKPTEQPAAASAGGGSYTVKNGDSLAKIAGKNKIEGVSLDQMLVALYRANQDAFTGGNINRLKSGVILNLPDKEAASAVAPADAHRLLVAQSADWKSYQDKVAGGAQAAPAEKPAAAPKKESGGRITAKVEDQAQKADAGDKLTLTKPGDAPKGGDAKKGGAGASKGGPSAEDLVAKDRQLRDANSRVAELEKNVRDLQNVLNVKNQALADLQKQAEQAKAEAKKSADDAKKSADDAKKADAAAKAANAKAAAVPPPAPPVVAKAEPPKAVEAPKAPEPPKAAEAPKAEAPKAEPPKAEPAKADAPKADAKGDAPKADAAATPPAPPVSEPPKAEQPKEAPKAEAPKAEAPKAAEAPKEPPKKAAQPTPPASEPSLMDEFLDNPLYMGAGALVLLGLAAYAVIAVRRKRKVESFESSIITGGDLKANSVFGNTGGQSVDTGNSSFQSDFSQVGPGAIDADEVDPVAEADVYMAYGRDAQAEEILKEALVKDPNRQTVRMKLLEIYSQRRDPKSFEAQANELHSSTGGHGEHWNRAVSLGQQIDPSNPLYGGSGEAAESPTSTQPIEAGSFAAALAGGAAAAAASHALDKTVSLETLNPAQSFAPAEDPLTKTVALEALENKQQPADIDLDFDLGGDTSQAAASTPDFVLGGEGGPNTEPDASAVDFDLGFGDAPSLPETPAPASAHAPAAAAPTDFSPSGTLIIEAPSLSALGTPEKTIEMNPVQVPEPPTEAAGNEIDFDFDIGSPPSAPAASAAAPAAPAGNSMDFDLSSISLDLPADVNGSDDAATKLDLAKAYQEMGDKDGAKELLGEVLKEGSAAQKAEAEQLLASI